MLFVYQVVGLGKVCVFVQYVVCVVSVYVVVCAFPVSASLSCTSVCSLGLLTPVIVGGSGCALIPFNRAVPAFGM